MAIARAGAVDAPPIVQVGDLSITILDGGTLWLDGGAMFGIIPYPVWSRLVEVDDARRIPLAMTCFLVETEGRRILVETGAGPIAKYNEKEQGFFKFGGHSILDSLAAAGIERESIDTVILTHLHFDHAGGGTMAAADDPTRFVPAFPRAQYVVQRGEWADAIAGHGVMTGTYRAENLAPLEDAEVLRLVDGDAEIARGVWVTPMAGHTRHQQAVVFDGGNERAALPADLMPTAAHVGLRYNMGYDLLPFENMRNKERLLKSVSEDGWTLLLGQDPKRVVWRARPDERRGFALDPA